MKNFLLWRNLLVKLSGLIVIILISNTTVISEESQKNNVIKKQDEKKSSVKSKINKDMGSEKVEETVKPQVTKVEEQTEQIVADKLQVYGWRENIYLGKKEQKYIAKLDTGARTSSLNAIKIEIFERDGRKWVKFIIKDARKDKAPNLRLEAPLVRLARVKDTSGRVETREVVILSFRIGDRKIRGEFTLNNRNSMLVSILLGRNMIKQLGLLDTSRKYLAEHKIFR